jgi:phage regulator Rha-like protein
MRSQIVTASGKPEGMPSQVVTASQKKRNVTATPYAFTEHGVTMLASVLRSNRAVKMNIAIVRAFIALREMVLQHKHLAEQINRLRTEVYERLGEHDTQLNAIYDAIENLLDDKAEKKNWEERERIGFKK